MQRIMSTGLHSVDKMNAPCILYKCLEYLHILVFVEVLEHITSRKHVMTVLHSNVKTKNVYYAHPMP